MLSMLRLNTEITKPHRTQFQKHDGAVVRRSHVYCQESSLIMTHRDTQSFTTNMARKTLEVHGQLEKKKDVNGKQWLGCRDCALMIQHAKS